MVSGIVTLTLLLLFVAGWAWAWRPQCKAEFDRAAQLPLQDYESPDEPQGQEASR